MNLYLLISFYNLMRETLNVLLRIKLLMRSEVYMYFVMNLKNSFFRS